MTVGTTRNNLCDTCQHCPADYGADETDIEFGDTTGNENMIGCEVYRPKRKPTVSDTINWYLNGC